MPAADSPRQPPRGKKGIHAVSGWEERLLGPILRVAYVPPGPPRNRPHEPSSSYRRAAGLSSRRRPAPATAPAPGPGHRRLPAWARPQLLFALRDRLVGPAGFPGAAAGATVFAGTPAATRPGNLEATIPHRLGD